MKYQPRGRVRYLLNGEVHERTWPAQGVISLVWVCGAAKSTDTYLKTLTSIITSRYFHRLDHHQRMYRARSFSSMALMM